MKGVECEGMNLCHMCLERRGTQGARLRMGVYLDELRIHHPPVVPVLREKKGVGGHEN